MSFVNPYKQYHNNPQSNAPQKLSMLYIEHAYFHRIQIKTISSIYKLNVRLKKPTILSLHSLPVIKYIIDHSECLNSLLRMQNLHQLKLSVPGYGLFNQKYELDRIGNLFNILAQYCQHVSLNLKKIILQFQGWRTFHNQFIKSLFKFISKCQILEEITININHAMSLSTKQASQDGIYENQSQNRLEKNQNQEDIFYGCKLFKIEQFRFFMDCFCSSISRSIISKIQLRFAAWEGVSNKVLQVLVQSIKQIYEKFKNIKSLKLDLSGWGTGQYQSEKNEIKVEMVDKLFRTIEEFDGNNSQFLQLDMRHWPKKYKISKYKDRFLYLTSGGKKKDDLTNTFGMCSFTGTNFFGSQMKSKFFNKMKIQIKD